MRHESRLAVLAAALCAPVAAAQLNPIISITNNTGDGLFTIGDTVTWTASISWTSDGRPGGGDDYLFGANLRFDAVNDCLIGRADNLRPGASIRPGTTFSGGTASGFSIDNVTLADFFGGLFGRPDANGDPFILMTWDMHIENWTGRGRFSYTADKRSLGISPALTIASGGASFAPPFVTNNFQTHADFTVVSDVIRCIPTPGVLAVIGLTSLRFVRRAIHSAAV